MLLLSGVAAHMPLEPSLNPKGDTSYTNYVADQMEKGSLAVCGVTKYALAQCLSILLHQIGPPRLRSHARSVWRLA